MSALPEMTTDERNEEVLKHRGLVALRVKLFLGRGVPFADLCQAGMIGLMKAVERFDSSRGIKFGTFARHYIDNAIRREIIGSSRSIRLPEWAWKAVGRYRKAAGKLAPDAPPAAILAAMGAPARKHAAILTAVEEAARVCDGTCLHWQPDSRPEADAELSDAERFAPLRSALSAMDETPRGLVSLMYGFDGESLSVHAASLRLGLAPTTGRRVHAAALATLRRTTGVAS